MQTLHDRQGRHFPYLRLSLTDLCNFHCNYCLPDGCQTQHHRQGLTITEIQRLIRAFAAVGVQKIRLTGGEPTLRTDFLDIIRIIKHTEGIRHIAMTTNGYKMDQRVSQWLDAGINAINISMDSLDSFAFQQITGHNRLQEVLKGIDQALQSEAVKLKINTVLMKGINDKELTRFLEWIRCKPITLRFIELMQTGDNPAFFTKHHVDGQIIRQWLTCHGWMPIIRPADAGPAQEFFHPDFQGKIGLIMPYDKDFCKSCNRLRVTSLGQLQLCLFADGGIDLRDLLQHDHQHQELISRIHSSLLLKEDRHYLDQGITGNTHNLAQIGG
ncbi:GTP 3',8-cyclase [invertebrate metagenome]|uniref:GTP 3',8-cyclase n=1 Tax=invertebrate metagenome TaxID=1711999 RepID=A0A2H9T874_9ZZZZ